MQDRFKFRVYSPVQGTMAEVVKIDFENDIIYDKNGEGFKSEQVILMQSTGYKDKNGKLIYVGDILEIRPMIPTLKFIIKGCVERTPRGSFGVDGYGLIGEDVSNSYEIIGNRYQDDPLLKEIYC